VGGQTAVGVQAAARIFFDKPASQLSLGQAALLAGLPQAPSQYNPFLDANAALARRNEVLRNMADQGYISEATAARQEALPLGVRPSHYYSQRREGYFFDFVKQALIDHYGLDTVRRGGLRVDTTLNLKMQEAARRALVGHLGAPDRAGAIVTMDPHSGDILAMASSSQYASSKFNLAAQGHRQAGSTFKVMVLMAALNRGVDPNSTTYVSRHLQPGWLPSNPSYEVQTYSHSYRGRINLVQATLASDNSVYAQLDADLGPESVTRTAKAMGITSPLESLPAEGLGGLKYGVSPLEMTRAYATIANGGWRVRPVAVTRVLFPDGHVDRSMGELHRHRAFSDGVTYEATQILEKNVLEGTGTAAQIGCPAAGKTGTVDNYTDAWFVGFTPRLVSAVWVGHPHDPYPLGPGAAGGVVAAPIWGAYMKTAHGSFCGDFPRPLHPFAGQPFFGKYSRSGGNGKSNNQYGGNSFNLTPGAGGTPYQSTTPNQGTTTGGQNGKYPPQFYATPPQTTPSGHTPPGQQKKGNGGTTGGGTPAPTGH
jgi:penicillin-binding protein 1A